jgi:hypothetical protein
MSTGAARDVGGCAGVVHRRQKWRLLMLRFLRPGIDMMSFGAGVLLASFASSCVFAHDARHQPTEQAAATTIAEKTFLDQNEAAMAKMMNDMAAKPSGDIDRDFVAMMTPHHQGAIDMAVIELRYGKSEQLRRIAQEIIVDQMQEIAAMKLAIGEQVSAFAPAPTQSSAPESRAPDTHMDMSAGTKK